MDRGTRNMIWGYMLRGEQSDHGHRGELSFRNKTKRAVGRLQNPAAKL